MRKSLRFDKAVLEYSIFVKRINDLQIIYLISRIISSDHISMESMV